MKRKQTTRRLPVPRATTTFLRRDAHDDAERERERLFWPRYKKPSLSVPDVHARKSVGRLKKETRTCLRSGEGGRKGRGRHEVEKKLVVRQCPVSRAWEENYTSPLPVCVCVCQWFRRSNNRVRRSYVTIQATLLLVAYQRLPSLLKIDRSYDPWTRVILSLAFRLVSAPQLRVFVRAQTSIQHQHREKTIQ